MVNHQAKQDMGGKDKDREAKGLNDWMHAGDLADLDDPESIHPSFLFPQRTALNSRVTYWWLDTLCPFPRILEIKSCSRR